MPFLQSTEPFSHDYREPSYAFFSQVLLKRDSVIFSFSLVFVFQMFSQSSHMIYSGSLDRHIHISSKPENKIHWMDIENKPLTSHSALKGLTKQCKNLRSLINPLKPVKTHIRPNCLKNWYFYKTLIVILKDFLKYHDLHDFFYSNFSNSTYFKYFLPRGWKTFYYFQFSCFHKFSFQFFYIIFWFFMFILSSFLPEGRKILPEGWKKCFLDFP